MDMYNKLLQRDGLVTVGFHYATVPTEDLILDERRQMNQYDAILRDRSGTNMQGRRHSE